MVVGAVSLAPGSQDILVGMGFLRQFKLGMIMVKDSIVLIDEEELEKIEQRQKKDEKQRRRTTGPTPANPATT
jgi:hypothetical protein